MERFSMKIILKDYRMEIREICLSERRFYQKIMDIYATSIKRSPVTKKFILKVQNKMHYAVTGNTPAEIIFTCADSPKEYNLPNSRR